MEPFPVFKKKMEREFDEITEQFKRLSIDNLDEEMAEAVTNFSTNVIPDDSHEKKVEALKNSNEENYESYTSIRCKNFLASQLASLLMEDLMNVMTNMIW